MANDSGTPPRSGQIRIGRLEDVPLRTLLAAFLAGMLATGAASCTTSRPAVTESLRTDGSSDSTAGRPPAPTTSTTTPADPSLVPGLLTVADLPAGFKVDGTNADPGGIPFIPSSSCYGSDPTLGIAPLQTATRTYSPSRPAVQFVVETIDRYRPTDAVALLARTRQVLFDCMKSPHAGMQFVAQARPYGDDSLSIQVISPWAYLAIVRVGDLVAVVLMGESRANEALLATVAARLRSIRPT